MKYRLLADEPVLDFALTVRSGEQRRLANALQGLTTSPFQAHDREMVDAGGNFAKVRLTGGFRVAFMVDHVRKEVTVLKVERATPGRRSG